MGQEEVCQLVLNAFFLLDMAKSWKIKLLIFVLCF